MNFKYQLLFVQFAVLANGDLLEEFVKGKLEDLPNWLKENVADELYIADTNVSSYQNPWIQYNLNSMNYIVKGLKSIELQYDHAEVRANLYTARCTIKAYTNMNLTVSGSYEIDGVLFPYFEQIPFVNFGLWSANLNVDTLVPSYEANINIGKDSFINFGFHFSVRAQNIVFSDHQMHNFLPDHATQWYYQTIKESFGNRFRSDVKLKLPQHLNFLQPFHEEALKNITYFDIVGIH